MEQKVKKITKLEDCKIVLTPTSIPNYWWQNKKTEEEKAKERIRFYENWVSDFKEFLRDHRSQDVQYIEVEKIYKDVCSRCGSEWEEYEDEGLWLCANCGYPTEKNETIKEQTKE